MVSVSVVFLFLVKGDLLTDWSVIIWLFLAVLGWLSCWSVFVGVLVCWAVGLPIGTRFRPIYFLDFLAHLLGCGCVCWLGCGCGWLCVIMLWVCFCSFLVFGVLWVALFAGLWLLVCGFCDIVS